jgi:hypothetical protein
MPEHRDQIHAAVDSMKQLRELADLVMSNSPIAVADKAS